MTSYVTLNIIKQYKTQISIKMLCVPGICMLYVISGSILWRNHHWNSATELQGGV